MRSDAPHDEKTCHTLDWCIGQCPCGRLTMKLGQVAIEFTRDELSSLHRLIAYAMKEFEIAPSAQPVGITTSTSRPH